MTPFVKKAIVLFTFLIIFYTYMVYLPVNYNFDGTVFSQFLRYATHKNTLEPVIQIHHLLYFPVNVLLYKGFQQMTPFPIQEYYFLQLFSLLFGLLTLMVVYRIFLLLKIPFFYRISGIFLTAFSYLFWLYSVEAEVHIPGMFFLTLGAAVLFFKPVNSITLISSALLFVLGATFHLTNGLMFVSALVFLLASRAKKSHILLFTGSYFGFLGLIFLGTRVLFNQDIIFHIRNFVSPAYSTTHTTPGSEIWQCLISGRCILKSLVAVKNTLFTPVSLLQQIISWILFVSLAGSVVYAFRTARKTAIIFLAWMTPFFLFFTYWHPSNIEFKLSIIVPLLMLAVTAVSKMDRTIWIRVMVPALAVLLFSFNFFTTIRPMSLIKNNRDYLVSQSIGDKTDPNATIIIAGQWRDSYLFGKAYIPYFSHRSILVMDWRLGNKFDLSQIGDEITRRTAQGESFYFLSDTLSLRSPVKEMLAFHHIPDTAYRKFLERFTLGDPIHLDDRFFLKKLISIGNR